MNIQQAEMDKRVARLTNRKSSKNSVHANEDDDVGADDSKTITNFQVKI